MTRRHVYKADREAYEDDMVEIGPLVGEARALDPLELTKTEQQRERAKLRERLKRKRPIGFASEWPEEET